MTNTHRPAAAAWITLVVIGALAAAMGIAFALLRPLIVLLPEDQHYTGLTPEQLRELDPQLFDWIGMVFRSWGAFALGLGIAIIGLAAFAYRRGEVWAQWVLVITGIATFSIFLTVNVLLRSDFSVLIAILLAAYMGALFYGWYTMRKAQRLPPADHGDTAPGPSRTPGASHERHPGTLHTGAPTARSQPAGGQTHTGGGTR